MGKLRAARARMRREKGRCEGRKPFGQRPGESETLARIRQLNRKPRGGKRLSTCKIAAKLNEEGCATRSGVPWTPQVVAQIIKREGLSRG